MDILIDIVQTITGMGAAAILPIIIFVLGLVFRVKPGAALKAGLMVGVGFIGLGLVITLLTESLQPAIEHYGEMGTGFTIMDIGWSAVGAASWMVPFAGLAVPIGVVLNIILVRMKLTKTLNVDIWNYMHFLVPGSLTFFLFDSFWLGLAVTVTLSVIALFVGDKTAKMWQDYYGLEDTTCTTLIHTGWTLPIAWILNKIIDFIPGLNKLDLSVDKVSQKMGIFGEPIVIGLMVGVLLGVLTGQELTMIIPMGMGVAGAMILMPRVVSVLMEGLSPIGKSAKDFLSRQMGEDAEVNVGMDVALGLGDPATITATVVSIPLVMLMALILPNIQIFPIGLLMSIVYMTPMTVMASKGNLFRSIATTVLFSVLVMYLAAYVAPGATQMLHGAGLEFDGLGTDFVLTGPWSILMYWLSNIF